MGAGKAVLIIMAATCIALSATIGGVLILERLQGRRKPPALQRGSAHGEPVGMLRAGYVPVRATAETEVSYENLTALEGNGERVKELLAAGLVQSALPYAAFSYEDDEIRRVRRYRLTLTFAKKEGKK